MLNVVPACCTGRCVNALEELERGPERTEASNALNSCSLDFLYSSISFEASVLASLSFWTRSERNQIRHWLRNWETLDGG